MSQPTSTSDANAVFDVRPIPCRVKHAQIFQRWFELPVGQYFILLNDHDPMPLRYQCEAEFSGAFSWEYLERGPDEFRVKISKLQSIAAAESSPAHPAPVPTSDQTAAVNCNLQELDVRGFEPP